MAATPKEQGDLPRIQAVPEGLSRFKRALDDHRAAYVQHGQGEKADASDMEHGQNREVPVVGGEVHGHGEIDGVPEAGPLAQDCPFGLACGACGIHDNVGGIQFREPYPG